MIVMHPYERRLREALFEASIAEYDLLVTSVFTPNNIQQPVSEYMTRIEALDEVYVETDRILGQYVQDVVVGPAAKRAELRADVQNLTHRMQLSINKGDLYKMNMDRKAKHRESNEVPMKGDAFFAFRDTPKDPK